MQHMGLTNYDVPDACYRCNHATPTSNEKLFHCDACAFRPLVSATDVCDKFEVKNDPRA